MSPKNFLVDYVGLPLECEETVKLLSSAIDTTGDGRISYTEFVAFEALLCMPDSLFRVAYQVFYDLFCLIQTFNVDFYRLGKFTVDLARKFDSNFYRVTRLRLAHRLSHFFHETDIYRNFLAFRSNWPWSGWCGRVQAAFISS